MGNIQTLADLLALIRRRRWLIGLVVVLGMAASVMVALRQPHVWESATFLQVDLPSVSADTARAEAVSMSAQRLQLLEQQITSRDAMLAMIDSMGLFSEFPGLTVIEKVVALRRSIRIETIRASQSPYGGEPPVSGLLIVVQLGDRQQAADVANALAAQVLERSADRQSERVRETLDFYNREEARLGDAIAALETEITSFKNANVEALPEAMQARRDELGRLDSVLRELDVQLLGLRQDQAALRRDRAPRAVEQRQIETLQVQIEGLEGQRNQLLDRRLAIESAINSAPAVETRMGTFERRLQQLQEQYAAITIRRAEAETGQRLESARQTERFEVLETALPGDYPIASGRKKTVALGAFASLFAALALAVLLDLRNPVLRSARQFQRALDLRPVIALPDLGKPRRQRRRSGKRASAV